MANDTQQQTQDFLNAILAGRPMPGQQAPAATTTPSTTPAQSSADYDARAKAAIDSWNANIPGAVAKGVQEGSAATGGTAATDQPTTPLFDPLAVQLFFTQAIAPILKGLGERLGTQNLDFAKMAQANLEHFQMPEAYKAIFGQSIPRQAAAQNDVLAALSGAAAAGPALDQLMNAIGQARSASYSNAQAIAQQNALGGAGGGLDMLAALGIKPTG